MTLRYLAIPTETAARYRAGAPDANGHPPERRVSDGGGNPCRHCLRDIPEGKPMLVLAHRPFPEPQPYAEVGPIFLCAEPCERHPDAASLPEMFRTRASLIARGYGSDDRIVYGTGKVTPTADLDTACAGLLANPRVAYVHLRSASNNCFQARVERG
jgi:hypothetical protein